MERVGELYGIWAGAGRRDIGPDRFTVRSHASWLNARTLVGGYGGGREAQIKVPACHGGLSHPSRRLRGADVSTDDPVRVGGRASLGHDICRPSRFDKVAFLGPYILIAHDNTAVGTATSLEDAHGSVARNATVTTFAGTLRKSLLAVDIDPTDTAAEPEAGEALAGQLESWCERLGLSWMRRASGRPGHQHLVVHVPDNLRNDFRGVVRSLADHHSVSATVRTTLRPLCAPHRSGVPASAVSGNLTTTGLDELELALGTEPVIVDKACVGGRRTIRRRAAREHAQSRSEMEFGETLARIRARWTFSQAWDAACQPGTKAAEIGLAAWRRWVWAPAVTIVDAERHVDVSVAWKNFRTASPQQAAHLGYADWVRSRWQPAVEEARRSRPRRTRTGQGQARGTLVGGQVTLALFGESRVETTADRLAAVAYAAASLTGRLLGGVRVKTLCIALRVLARAIVAREGSMSVREWSEQAGLDPKTVRRARDAAKALGLIQQVHRYGGQAEDCDAWLPTPALKVDLDWAAAQAHSPTGRYAPYRGVRGDASRDRLRKQHAAERSRWRAHLEARKRYLRLLSSSTGRRAHVVLLQQRWWWSLSAADRAARRVTRRERLKKLPVDVRHRWFAWLAVRREVVAGAIRIVSGGATFEDWRRLRDAPSTVFAGVGYFKASNGPLPQSG